MTVEPGANRGYDLRRRQSVGCRLHREPCHLALQVAPLIPRGHSGIDSYSRGSLDRLVYQDRPRRELVGRDWQGPGVEPAGSALAAHAVLPRPLGQLHALHHDGKV